MSIGEVKWNLSLELEPKPYTLKVLTWHEVS